MNAIKERIMGAVTVMNDEQAEKIWNIIKLSMTEDAWENIEEIEPDEIDIQMQREIDSDSDCKEFLSSDAALKEIGLL
ncbi:MAG: hypothetical protein K2N01_07735 [Lachnospiraceae bacterium]|nr:hypothetical protein [Lachnospiraceae bacterium]